MGIDFTKDVIELAFQFVNFTNNNVFLTGGAGTGKTTFLKRLKDTSHKKIIIAAPTGVAAINAGGITIHSLFGLPSSFQEKQIKDFRISRENKILLRELEVLVIDETSMLQADLLDTMDFLLRDVRQNTQPMGGLQILFVGDLYQLPPIDNNVGNTKTIYECPYFLGAKVFRSLDVVTIELTEVHRQVDLDFIQLLNDVRKGSISSPQLSKLNERYVSGWESLDNILLTTHNKYAKELNNTRLNALPGTTYVFQAKVFGEFPEDKFPADNVLEIRIHSKVMMLKNDPSDNREFYNGKIGSIHEIRNEQIDVKFDDGIIVTIGLETWSNIGYSINGENGAIMEIVLGTFQQFPIRLAWAITIHKSQGLTFEAATLDIANAFSPGQVYVALSRIKTLAGITLKSEIPKSAIITPNIDESLLRSDLFELSQKLGISKKNYIKYYINTTFDLRTISANFINLRSTSEEILNVLAVLKKLEKHAGTFIEEVRSLMDKNDPDWNLLAKRVTQAKIYFANEISTNCVDPIKFFVRKNRNDFMFRGEINNLKGCLKELQDKIQMIVTTNKTVNSALLGISSPEQIFSEKALKKSKPKHKVPNPPKVSTSEQQTLQFFMQGLTIPQIAHNRGLGISAIEAHLATFILSGEVVLTDIIPSEILSEVLPLLNCMNSPSIAEIRRIVDGRLTIGQLHALAIYLK